MNVLDSWRATGDRSRIVATSISIRSRALAPGLALVALIGAASWVIAQIEQRVLGHPVVEALVVAILLGMIVRTARAPSARSSAGVRFAGKELLEAAVLLL